MSTVMVAEPIVGRLRILMVTARYLPQVGGTEIHTYETARRIAAAGHEVTVLTTRPDRATATEEWLDGVHVKRVNSWLRSLDLYIAPQMYRVITGQKWDVVHCQGVHTLVAPLAMLAALRAHNPYVVTFHTGGHSSRLRNAVRGLQWRSLQPLLARAEYLIGVSRFETDVFRKRLHLPSEQFVIIPNGAQLPESTPDVHCQPDGALIVSVGRLERYKGHHRVIAALPYVLARRPDTRLRIVGRGPYEGELRRLACELGVADRVETGAIAASDRDGMASVLSRAALVTLLSEYESQGIAVFEALKLRRPVLVADTSALSDLAHQRLVRAVPLESSPQQVAEAILQQLDHPLTPQDVPVPSWDDCSNRLLALYCQIGRARCAY
jgi:glycosyltransferase involved in cell wall biosynthesis